MSVSMRTLASPMGMMKREAAEEAPIWGEGRDERLPAVRGDSQSYLCHAAAEAEHVGDLRGGVLLLPVEDVGARDLGGGELVHLHVRSEGDDSDQRVVGEVGEVLLQRVLETGELLRVDRRVDDEQEHGRNALTALDLVLDGGVCGHHLVRQRCLRDVLGVLGREVVSLSAEGAGPELRAEVDLAAGEEGAAMSPVGVQNGSAVGLAAAHGLIRQSGRHGVDGLQWRVSVCEWDGHIGYRHPMGITHLVASMRVPGQVLKVKRIPSRSSASPISVTWLFIIGLQ